MYGKIIESIINLIAHENILLDAKDVTQTNKQNQAVCIYVIFSISSLALASLLVHGNSSPCNSSLLNIFKVIFLIRVTSAEAVNALKDNKVIMQFYSKKISSRKIDLRLSPSIRAIMWFDTVNKLMQLQNHPLNHLLVPDKAFYSPEFQ
uniref:Uncharacterized protein n=1 Tax=Glossina pallidipes TaxID=7398 RepID=A0A1A9ZD40_GLOPL